MDEISFEHYMTMGILIVLGIVALIILIGLIFVKHQPDRVFITDKGNLFIFNAKDISSAHVERSPGGDHYIVLAQKYKHGYWVTKILCESKEHGSRIIGNISEVLSKA